MKGKLLPSKILVEQISEKEEVTASGIIITSDVKSEKSPNFVGKIVLTGPYTEDDIATTGDTIAFSRLSGMQLLIEGREYLVMSQKDILYVYEESVS